MTYRIFKNRLKKAHKSLTIWFNATGVLILAVIVNEPQVISFLNQNDLSFILMAGNMVLRFKTSSDMAHK